MDLILNILAYLVIFFVGGIGVFGLGYFVVKNWETALGIVIGLILLTALGWAFSRVF
jgi:cytochrome c biogenesis protein CcdA